MIAFSAHLILPVAFLFGLETSVMAAPALVEPGQPNCSSAMSSSMYTLKLFSSRIGYSTGLAAAVDRATPAAFETLEAGLAKDIAYLEKAEMHARTCEARRAPSSFWAEVAKSRVTFERIPQLIVEGRALQQAYIDHLADVTRVLRSTKPAMVGALRLQPFLSAPSETTIEVRSTSPNQKIDLRLLRIYTTSEEGQIPTTGSYLNIDIADEFGNKYRAISATNDYEAIYPGERKLITIKHEPLVNAAKRLSIKFAP